MRAIDLHTHSNCSDGSYSVKELIDYAHDKGLSAIALTDHDTVAGLDEGIAYTAGKYPDMEFVPGIEYSTVEEGKDVHIVGLYINHRDEAYQKKLQEFKDSRINRNIKMCKKLTEEAGIPITYDELVEKNPGAVITRAHYAKLIMEKGYVKSRQEVFDRLIGDNCPYFVPREKILPEQAIEHILQAGGVPILAHPILYRMSDERLENLVKRLKAAGLMGLEAIYSTYEPREERDMKALAGKYDLLVSGGSDFHGANKKDIDLAVGRGKLFVPEELLPPIKMAAGKK
ncbi:MULTISPECIES: PHP domain-containing protein [unclassified Butyrivibrio]|uniref:PHP domain-containing protein n=1 Tax=unclassified Butyrivibrio TaxID=2639466 RepID=UPI0003B61447|nr:MULTISPECIES: PHP domain-containing protein [unclassified Butyrivibrio]MDC7293922.1 PHP domain-containing protein [Butyrivibrio sp. DSM 10294]